MGTDRQLPHAVGRSPGPALRVLPAATAARGAAGLPHHGSHAGEPGARGAGACPPHGKTAGGKALRCPRGTLGLPRVAGCIAGSSVAWPRLFAVPEGPSLHLCTRRRPLRLPLRCLLTGRTLPPRHASSCNEPAAAPRLAFATVLLRGPTHTTLPPTTTTSSPPHTHFPAGAAAGCCGGDLAG